MCFGNGLLLIMFTGSARAWLRHWSHHKGVQGIKIGILSELRAIGNGMGILCVEGFTSCREPSTSDEQGFKMLKLAQCHSTQGVRDCS